MRKDMMESMRRLAGVTGEDAYDDWKQPSSQELSENRDSRRVRPEPLDANARKAQIMEHYNATSGGRRLYDNWTLEDTALVATQDAIKDRAEGKALLVHRVMLMPGPASNIGAMLRELHILLTHGTAIGGTQVMDFKLSDRGADVALHARDIQAAQWAAKEIATHLSKHAGAPVIVGNIRAP